MKKFNCKNKSLMWISSVLTLSPILASLIFFDSLPNQIPFHFDINGVADSFLPKQIAIFLYPIFFLLINIILNYYFNNKNTKKVYSNKVTIIVILFMPAMSCGIAIITIISSLNTSVDTMTLIAFLTSLMLIVVGNYLPKIGQNYVFGIRVPWVYHSVDNWKKTHLLGGRLFVIGGIIMLLCSLFSFTQIYFFILLIVCITPCIYSFIIYLKKI